MVGRPAAAERQPVVGGALPVDDQVAVVGEGLARGQPGLRLMTLADGEERLTRRESVIATTLSRALGG